MEIVTQPDANEIHLDARLHPKKCDKKDEPQVKGYKMMYDVLCQKLSAYR